MNENRLARIQSTVKRMVAEQDYRGAYDFLNLYRPWFYTGEYPELLRLSIMIDAAQVPAMNSIEQTMQETGCSISIEG